MLGNVFAHAVVDAPPGQDHVGVVAQHLGLVRQVIRVHTNAVAAHQPGAKRQKVPLGACGFQHFSRVQTHHVEDDGQLVHQRNVQVALGVFDHLGGLGHFQVGHTVHAGCHHLFVECRHPRQGLGGVTRHHFHGVAQGVLLVARVDALGRVAY